MFKKPDSGPSVATFDSCSTKFPPRHSRPKVNFTISNILYICTSYFEYFFLRPSNLIASHSASASPRGHRRHFAILSIRIDHILVALLDGIPWRSEQLALNTRIVRVVKILWSLSVQDGYRKIVGQDVIDLSGMANIITERWTNWEREKSF